MPRRTPSRPAHDYNGCMDKQEAQLIFGALEKIYLSLALLEERVAELAALAEESGYTNADYDL